MISNLFHLDRIKSSVYSGIIFLVCSDLNPVIILLYVARVYSNLKRSFKMKRAPSSGKDGYC